LRNWEQYDDQILKDAETSADINEEHKITARPRYCLIPNSLHRSTLESYGAGEGDQMAKHKGQRYFRHALEPFVWEDA
jgi:hypothetical protein